MPDLVCIKAVKFHKRSFKVGDVFSTNRWMANKALAEKPECFVSVGRGTPEKVAAVLEEHKVGKREAEK